MTFLSVSLNARNNLPLVKLLSLYQVERHFYHQRQGIQAKMPRETNCTTSLLIYYFKLKLCSNPLLIKHPKLNFFVLSIPFKYIVCKYVKVAFFGHFLHPISMGTLASKIKMCSFPLFICFMLTS